MAWPCSGPPFHSRTSNQLGRRGDGFFGEQYHPDPWRDPENVDKPNDSIHWDNSHSQVQEQVDHWAKFIEAIGRSGKRKSSPDSRYRPQEEEEKAPSPRRLHKQRLTSPQALRYGAETQRFQSPGQRRNEHHSRGPGSQEKRDNRMEHGYHNEEREERNSYSDRSQKSDDRGHHLQPKRFRPLDPQEHYSESHGSFNPYRAPVIVEHEHGIQKHDESNRDHPRRRDLVQNRQQGRIRGPSWSHDPDMNQGHPRSHGSDMSRGPSQSRDPHMSQGHPRSNGPDLNRGLSRSRDLDKNRGHPRTHGPEMNRGPSRSRDPDINRGPPRSHGVDLKDMNRGPPRSHGVDMKDMNRGTPRSHGVDMKDMNRGPPRSQESDRAHSRTRDPGVSQELHRSRSLPRSNDIVMNHEHSRNRNSHGMSDLPRSNLKGNKPQMDRPLSRTREPLRNRELLQHMGETDHHAEMLHDRHGGPTPYYLGEKATFQTSTVERGSPVCVMSQHREHPRMGSHPKQLHDYIKMELSRNVDFRKGDLRTGAHDRGCYMEVQPGKNHGGMREQGKAFRRIEQRGTPKTLGDREDFMEHETLKIKVDMSRPVGQSSHLGYSSERQLSLDLVNVGRQRLDFLPMLEHSGTYKETAVHSGTFAQEIITLVHHVKENYFQGQGITLNDRFSGGQSYLVVDEDELEEENQELEDTGPVINRPFGSTSNTQIYSEMELSQRRPQAPAPGDLRLDLERKRLQKLEAVKITIAGNTQAQDSQAYVSEEDSFEAGPDSGWSEQVPQSANKWDHPPGPKRPGPNVNVRRNINRFDNRPGPHRRQNPNSRGARW